MRKLPYMILIALLAVCLWFYDVQLYGDVFRLMLIPLGLYWLFTKQLLCLKYFICVSVIILGIAFGCKLAFVYIASHYGSLEWAQHIIEIAKRPINGEFRGFPSGHSSAAFAACALMWRFLGREWGIFSLILAIFVGYSRILSQWHTPTQVIAGAMLGFVGSFIVMLILDYIDKRYKKD
ncbi:phosphatase PAP2 family protein [Helicobacter marmotae]|uniref:Phosphatase PAP2 family protein n=1 Tax=Helicobacter marmotae TaxID=152490 RepID=A0A3D8I644_9HELI|nr:phosphatase PAP2 family protein [Helicobacter marmotae]RDU60031.1 phosphatase PAP2 family protein [Helicobacter marmotae]